MIYNIFKKNYSNLILLIFFLLVLFPQINFAKISDKRAVTTFWTEAPIMPGAAKYFIRTEKIEKFLTLVISPQIYILIML